MLSLIVGAVIRYTSHPNIELTAHASLDKYANVKPPEAVFVNFTNVVANKTEQKTIKYVLDTIVTEIEEEAALEKTVSICC
ncbi:hypothetical protein ACF0H5_020682 [Mactra antiquata]